MFLFSKKISLLMDKTIEFPDNSHNRWIMCISYNPKYLRNCGFALRAVPNGTVPSNPNEKITMLSNSQKENGKRVFGNKTTTPSAPLLRGCNTGGYATLLPLRPNPLCGLRIVAKPLSEIWSSGTPNTLKI